MIRDVISVNANSPLDEIVALMEEHRIKRVPVLDDGKVVGLVSRADLLRALAVAAREHGAAAADDPTIRNRILEAFEREPMGAAGHAERDGSERRGRSLGHDQQRSGATRHLRDS